MDDNFFNILAKFSSLEQPLTESTQTATQISEIRTVPTNDTSCQHCQGTGSDKSNPDEPWCHHCEGTGQLTVYPTQDAEPDEPDHTVDETLDGGWMESSDSCPHCGSTSIETRPDNSKACCECPVTWNTVQTESDDEDQDDEPDICPTCDGSGEGYHDGSWCASCHGTGVKTVNAPKDSYTDPDAWDGETVYESAPPGMENTVLALKKKYPDNEKKAFAIAWSQYNKKHPTAAKKVNEGPQDAWAKQLAAANRKKMAADREARAQASRSNSRTEVAQNKKQRLDKIFQAASEKIAAGFPDLDPIDAVGPWAKQNHVSFDEIQSAFRAHGYRNGIYGYFNDLEKNYSSDALAESHSYQGNLTMENKKLKKIQALESHLAKIKKLAEGKTEFTATGRIHHGHYGTEYQGDEDDELDTKKSKKAAKKEKAAAGEKRGRGRPKKDRAPEMTKLNDPFGHSPVKAPKIPKGLKVTKHKIAGESQDLEESMYALEQQFNRKLFNENSPAVFDHILNTYRADIKDFQNHGQLSDHLYDALYDYYLNAGEMPYGIAKSRTGDPQSWVADKFSQELNAGELDEVALDKTHPDYPPSLAGGPRHPDTLRPKQTKFKKRII